MAILLKWQFLVAAGRDSRTLPPSIFKNAADRQELEITAMILKYEIYLFLNRLKKFDMGNLISSWLCGLISARVIPLGQRPTQDTQNENGLRPHLTHRLSKLQCLICFNGHQCDLCPMIFGKPQAQSHVQYSNIISMIHNII